MTQSKPHNNCVMLAYKIKLLLLIIASFLSINIAYAETCPLQGSWQSNATKTLASMNSTGQLNEKQRTFFENDFFGELVVIATCDEITNVYEDYKSTTKYQLVSTNGNKIKIRYFDEIYDNGKQIVTITLEEGGNCYSIPYTNLNFKEYFCKIN